MKRQAYEYQSPITKVVSSLVEMALSGRNPDGTESEEKINPLLKIALNGIKPQLPIMLYKLDTDARALQGIQLQILKVCQETLLKEKGAGYLAWINPACPDENKRIERLCMEEDNNANSGNQKLG